MQKVFIHVGLHKTGTTTFQKFIWPQLKKYIYLSRPYTQHNQAFNRLQYADIVEYNEKEIYQEITQFGSKNLFLSDESFSGKPVTFSYINRSLIAERLASVWPQAEIIIFLRDQKDFLRSIYSSYIKMPYGTKRIKDFLWKPEQEYSFDNYRRNKKSSMVSMPYNSEERTLNIEALKYSEILKMYQNRFPKVHVFLYESFRDFPADCIQEMSTVVEGDLEYRPAMRSNSSLSYSDMELIRYLNIFKPVIGKIPAKVAKNIEIFKRFANGSSSSLSQEVDEFVGDYYSMDNYILKSRLTQIDFNRFPTAYN